MASLVVRDTKIDREQGLAEKQTSRARGEERIQTLRTANHSNFPSSTGTDRRAGGHLALVGAVTLLLLDFALKFSFVRVIRQLALCNDGACS